MKAINHKALTAVVAVAAFVLCLLSCDSFDSYSVTEAEKDLSGVWNITAVTRNGENISQQMDFSQFALNLNADGTYTIDNYLPFVVRESGKWKTDDKLYPFMIVFQENGSASETKVEFSYPVVNGQRALNIILSPGCSSNTYTYSLQRVSNAK